MVKWGECQMENELKKTGRGRTCTAVHGTQHDGVFELEFKGGHLEVRAFDKLRLRR
jgi:hypothetical protein